VNLNLLDQRGYNIGYWAVCEVISCWVVVRAQGEFFLILRQKMLYSLHIPSKMWYSCLTVQRSVF